MLEQKKKINLKSLLRYRRRFKNFKSIISPRFYFLKAKFLLQINIKITSNNVFCTLTNTKLKKTLLVTSSGKEKIATSKKLLNFSSKNILLSFFRKVKSYVKFKNILIKITASKRIKILIFKILSKITTKKLILLSINPKKCFNGCKVKKKKRKKQKSLRIFK